MDQLVSTEWLAGRLEGGDLLVLDASQHLPVTGRDAAAEFAAAHIPGARFLDLASLIDETSGVPKALPRGEQVAERLASLGAMQRQEIVLYDDSAIRTAARAWFILRMYGMKDVAILDGGLAKWRAEARQLESGMPTPQPGDILPAPARAKVRTLAEIFANLTSGAEQVIDARDAARFAGTASTDPHGQDGGHIPGSRNLHYAELFREDGSLRPKDELRCAFEAAGIDLDAPIVATCGSGVTACVLLFALAQIGKDEGALYDGSWLEWGGDPGTPKESGAPR